MPKTAIIIPCYNEVLRLDTAKIALLAQQPGLHIYFVNDGSTDQTVVLIKNIISKYQNCFLIDYVKNEGKAAVIYKAVHHLDKMDTYNFIGYFDADFSTPPDEILRLVHKMETSFFDFVFGSRILLLNSGIQRKTYRHFIGRAILTLINIKFRLGIYDTQCGAKLFSKDIIADCFDKPFYTSWLFDVEIFIRLQKKNLLHKGKEIPIYNWRDVDGSKLGIASSFKILKEFISIYRHYE